MKRIGIFTKMEMAGGSEFRAVEMASAISRVDGYQSVLLVEKDMPSSLRSLIPPNVELREGVFTKPDLDAFYSVDHLLVINTDSRDFTTDVYWRGESAIHSYKVNLSLIPQINFLFNFIVSPACSLPSISNEVEDVRIITANSKFFNEISEQERYREVRHYPRLQLESPIDPFGVREKTKSSRLRFGMHSLPNPDKWNKQLPDLVRAVNERCAGKIMWDFMGPVKGVARKMTAENVIVRPEFFLPVEEYLSGIDVFVFFVSWKREEPWSRSVAEALMSGCPIITIPRGGNRNQVVHGNTGFLCRTLDDFVDHCCKVVDEPKLLSLMGRNAKVFAKNFTSAAVVAKFLEFIE